MAPRPDVAVRVEGLRSLRSDLRAISRGADRELGRATKEVANRVIVPTARREAPRVTGRLAARTVAGVRGDKTVIRNPLPYAAPIHWGWPGRGIEPSPFIPDAVEQHSEEWTEELGDAIDTLARRYGFR